MDNGNKKNDELGVDQDDDPTVELEVLPEAVGEKSETYRAVDSESGQHTSGFAELNNKFNDANEAVSNLESNLNSRVESNGEMQFEIDLLRLKWAGLEKEVKVLEEAMSNIAKEVTVAQEKQLHTNELLKKRDSQIESLRSQLLVKEQSIEELSSPEIQTGSGRRAISASTSRVDTNDEQHQFALLVPLDGNTLSDHPIQAGQLSLGSSPDNDIYIHSQFVSRHHARIVSNSSHAILDDLNSTNGTYVNAKRIKRHALRNGDSITVGKHRFKFVQSKSDTSDNRSAFNNVQAES